ETGIVREDVHRHAGMRGEEQPVARAPVVRPFLVDPKILDRGFDFHDPYIAAGPEADDVGTAAGRERQLGDHRESARAKEAADAARYHQRGLGLPAVDGRHEVRVVEEHENKSGTDDAPREAEIVVSASSDRAARTTVRDVRAPSPRRSR